MTRSLNVAVVDANNDTDSPPRATFRERHRRQRHHEFLDTALEIVAREGLEALTMQRVTETLECATGSIYGYFPNKHALIAALQQEALLALSRSVLASQVNLDAHLADRDERFATLARAYAAGRFWIAAEDVFPQQIELCRRLFLAPGAVISTDDAETVRSPATALLDLGSALLDAATAAGALRGGDTFGRAVVILAGTGGVQLAAGLARWDERVEDTRPFAERMLADLFVAWGADPDLLSEIGSLIDEMSAQETFVPVVPNPEA